MLIEIGLIYWFMEFGKSHEWQQRPLKNPILKPFGGKHENVRHDHGFYPDGSNSGYFKDGVHADDKEHLKKYNKYPPKKGEMCRYPNIMKQAEKNVAKDFRADNYKAASFTNKQHNCHDYKEAVNKEYDRLFNEANKKNNKKQKVNKKNNKNQQNIKKQKNVKRQRNIKKQKRI